MFVNAHGSKVSLSRMDPDVRQVQYALLCKECAKHNPAIRSDGLYYHFIKENIDSFRYYSMFRYCGRCWAEELRLVHDEQDKTRDSGIR